jgi:hypothetical protein
MARPTFTCILFSPGQSVSASGWNSEQHGDNPLSLRSVVQFTCRRVKSRRGAVAVPFDILEFQREISWQSIVPASVNPKFRCMRRCE